MKINDYISKIPPEALSGEAKVKEQDPQVKPGREPAEEASGQDKVQISDRSREIARVRELVNAAPEVRSDKVAEMKEKLASGTYSVNGEQVAEAMMKSVIDETV